MSSRLDVRLAACSLGVCATAASALAAGREQIGYPALGAALLLVAGAGLAATRRNRRDVVVVAPEAVIRSIGPGQEGGSGRQVRAIGAA